MAFVPQPSSKHWAEIARVFTRLGFTAFGGPMAHLALMEDELITRRQWCDRQTFLNFAAAVQFIPGPNSTELAIYLGYLRGGFLGLVLAGACFITPAVLIILPIAWAYVHYGTLPILTRVLHTVAATTMIATIAAWRLGRDTLRGPRPWAIALLSLAVYFGLLALPAGSPLRGVQPEIVALAVAAAAGVLFELRPTKTLAVAPLGLAAVVREIIPIDGRWIEMLWLFFKTGITLFGSGYVLVSFLQRGLVDQHRWLTPQQLTDAVAVGQFTPGPLLTTATFAGYLLGDQTFGGGTVGGVLGAVLATLAIFLPSFLLVALLAPLLGRLQRSRMARAALDAMNAAVVALITVTAVRLGGEMLGRASGGVDWLNGVVFITALVLLQRLNLNATWVVLVSVGVGVVRHFVGA
jgi:chromate transporter